MFYFNDAFKHIIDVRLDRPKSPKTGTVEFAIPVRVSFQNRNGEWKEYFRAAKRTMQVLPRTPTIPKSSRAKARKLATVKSSRYLRDLKLKNS